MGDRLEAFEIEPSYDRDDPFDRGPRVLWGRVAALSAGLILFFLLGWIFRGGSSGKVAQLQTQLAQDEQRITNLQASLATAANQPPSPTPTPTTGALGGLGGTSATPTPTPTATSTSSGTGAGATQTYIVKVGDTLSTIAAKFYGTTGHDLTNLIAQANNITDPATIRVGMKLSIPPAPAGTKTTTPASPKATSSASPKPTTSTTPRPTASASR